MIPVYSFNINSNSLRMGKFATGHSVRQFWDYWHWPVITTPVWQINRTCLISLVDNRRTRIQFLSAHCVLLGPALTSRAEPHSWNSTGRVTPRNRHTGYAKGQCEIMKINQSLFHFQEPIHVHSRLWLFVFSILATGYQTKPLKMWNLYKTHTQTHFHNDAHL